MTEATDELRDLSPEEKKQINKEMQKHYNDFKKRFKTRSKSELIATIWEQGMAYRELQEIAQELFEENKTLKTPKQENQNEENC